MKLRKKRALFVERSVEAMFLNGDHALCQTCIARPQYASAWLASNIALQQTQITFHEKVCGRSLMADTA